MKKLLIAFLVLISLSAYSSDSIPKVAVNSLSKILKSEQLTNCKEESRSERLFTNSCVNFVNNAYKTISKIEEGVMKMPDDIYKEAVCLNLNLLKVEVSLIHTDMIVDISIVDDKKIFALEIEEKIEETTSGLSRLF